MLDLFNSLDSYGDVLYVRATTKAAANKIKVEHLADGTRLIKVYVTAAPEKGKANKAIIQLLAKELGISKSSLEIIKGDNVRDKVIRINKD